MHQPPTSMTVSEQFPTFASHLPDLNRFVSRLVQEYQAGELKTWGDLDERVSDFFTTAQIEAVESVVPGWRRMTSFLDGVTRTHVMGVFLGLTLLPEFQSLSQRQQQLAKWVVLFHDVEKEAMEGERDSKHGFRSAVTAARQLPRLGFATTEKHSRFIAPWSELTYSAVKIAGSYSESIQDNEKLPKILAGIERMFGEDTPASLIVKCVLLHMSISVVSDWSQAAPLTDKEIKKYVTSDLAPLLKVVMLADNDGWVLFYPEREQQRAETLEVFQRIEKLISG